MVDGIEAGDGTLTIELARASSALSRANAAAVDPFRHLIGALLDAVVAVEDLVAESAHSDGSPS